VSRPRLIARLDRGAEGKLTLVSAPAGFGKTTLLAEWLAAAPAGPRPAAWVSLDQGDNDPATFLAYVSTAMQRVRPGIGAHALALLQSPQPPPIESVVTTLINEVAAIEDDLTLVLDDLHAIDAQSVHSAIAYLLDHLPPRMHLVIASRADPPLPLARLRGRGESTELRAAELRFTPDEAAAFLNEAMGLGLSAGDVAALETRTEGWIAGLQLAALSMQGREDVSAFIRTFAGDDRYIVDYLAEEVLQRQLDEVRSFLLQTSMLDRLSGPLCDAVTGRDDGKRLLPALERGNLFVVPLDDKRQWYRYHHLFADVLRAHLLNEQPDRVPTLHRRAAAWFEERGMAAEAIDQARAAGDHDIVARLLVANWEAFERLGRNASVSGWAASLPDEMVRARPRLALIFAASSIASANTNEASRRLTSWAEDAIDAMEDRGGFDPSDDVDGTVIGPEGLDALKGELLALKIMHSYRSLLAEEIVAIAGQALTLLPRSMHRLRAMLRMMRATMQMEIHDLESGRADLEQAVDEARRARNPALLASVLTLRGQVYVDMGRLEDGRHSYEEALRASQETSNEAALEMCSLHTGLAEVSLERGDLAESAAHVARALEFAGTAPTRSPVLFARATAAQVMVAAGNIEAAFAQMAEAREFVRGSRDSRFHSFLASVTLNIHCRVGDLDAAADVVRERDLASDMAVDSDTVEEAIACARYLIGRGDGEGAARVLSRVLPIARKRGRVRDEIRALVLQAQAHELSGERALALASLGRATMLGEPGGFNRTFTGEGPVTTGLLEALVDAVRRGGPAEAGSASYLTWLLRETSGGPEAASAQPAATGLAEPLTPREVEILRLIAAGMRNQEIADRLFISLPTVKRHIANTYGKLGVGHRTEALARASELGLL
jgi:LuxR family transcriptional regulator, maltose regulon positive regulatory protein